MKFVTILTISLFFLLSLVNLFAKESPKVKETIPETQLITQPDDKATQENKVLFEDPKKLVEDVFYAVTSYYGKRIHNAWTANSEKFSRNKFTAAHKYLPFNTMLRVTNEANGKTVIVRVNDRGPFKKGRDLDLSYGAAKELGILRDGIKKLKVEIITN